MSLSVTQRLILYVHFGFLAALLTEGLIGGHPKWFGRAPWQTIAGFTVLLYVGVAALTFAAWIVLAQFRKRRGVSVGAIFAYLIILYVLTERVSLPNE